MAESLALPELEAFAAEPEFGGDDQQSYKYMYWRRPDGWITTGPAWATEYVKKIRRGFEPLEHLGDFYLDKVAGVQSWSSHREPYRQLFARGGSDLVRIDQIAELGWDIKPPYKGVVFPQLEGIEIHREPCHHCKRLFLDASPWGGMSATERLERHEFHSHREKVAAEATARAIREGVGGGSNAGSPELLAIVQQLMQANADLAKKVEAMTQERPSAPRTTTTKRKTAAPKKAA